MIANYMNTYYIHYIIANYMNSKNVSQITLDFVIQALQDHKSHVIYNNIKLSHELKNFQANSISINSNFSFLHLAENLKKIYWFSINEEYELSLKLLQCQLYGKVNEKKLKTILSKSYNVRSTQTIQSFQISSKNLADIKNLNAIDIKFYKMVVIEFAKRINQYASCLNTTTDISHLLL